MDFIKNMKKREFIEMGLKTLAALCAAFLAIILMEGMIYSIQLNALQTKSESSLAQPTTIAYCIEKEEDKYFVLYYNEDTSNEGYYEWSATQKLLSKDECEALSVKEVIYDAPNAFKFSITGTHYIVISIFVAIVAGYFVYRFVRLASEYKKIEENYTKTGTIEFNV